MQKLSIFDRQFQAAATAAGDAAAAAKKDSLTVLDNRTGKYIFKCLIYDYRQDLWASH